MYELKPQEQSLHATEAQGLAQTLFYYWEEYNFYMTIDKNSRSSQINIDYS